jgi:hypothetical protein
MATADSTPPVTISRAKANAALTLAIIALLLALLALGLTLGARNEANQAQETANKTRQYTQDTVEKALHEANKATSGSTGTNNPVPAEGTTLPNANGQ